MSYDIRVTDNFKREVKKLFKKYPSLKVDISNIIHSLETDPIQGSPLGKDCYKVRMAISSKGKGKSGGSRIITCVKIVNRTAFLLSIYDKSLKESLADNELDFLLKQAGLL
jgi:mRNA-degrading endonuclease RelE of RelBE toxin-antitoxin system